MSSIDKLALTCRLLYDERVLEQRKEIERLKVKLFFRVKRILKSHIESNSNKAILT
jgi:hypothetical protein